MLTQRWIVKSNEEYIVSMKIIAHRGYSAMYPENTMLSFRKAEEAGADGIEMDVHLSSDGECMVIHDEALRRTTGAPGVVSDYKRSELERLDAGYIKGGPSCPVPSLEELLDWIAPTSLMLNIELKTAPVCYPGLEEKVLSLVSRFSMEERVIYSSFNWLSVWRIKQLMPEARTGLLLDSLPMKDIGAQMREIGVEAYHPGYRLLSDAAVRELKGAGREINVWTVDKDDEVLKCLEWGIDGLITNNPENSRSVAGL